MSDYDFEYYLRDRKKDDSTLELKQKQAFNGKSLWKNILWDNASKKKRKHQLAFQLKNT